VAAVRHSSRWFGLLRSLAGGWALLAACASRITAASDGAVLAVDAVDGDSRGTLDGESDSNEVSTLPECPSVDEPLPMQRPCDHPGQLDCQNWAQQLVDAGMSYALCVSGPSMCARADHCATLLDPSTCRCGDMPACGLGAACVADTVGSTPRCRCIAM